MVAEFIRENEGSKMPFIEVGNVSFYESSSVPMSMVVLLARILNTF